MRSMPFPNSAINTKSALNGLIKSKFYDIIIAGNYYIVD